MFSARGPAIFGPASVARPKPRNFFHPDNSGRAGKSPRVGITSGRVGLTLPVPKNGGVDGAFGLPTVGTASGIFRGDGTNGETIRPKKPPPPEVSDPK